MTKKIIITPIGMCRNARIWNSIYYQNIGGDVSRQMVAVYCLLISVEMYLKAYLIFLNPKYTNPRSLRKLGHEYEKIIMALIKAKAPKGLIKLLKTTIIKYRLKGYNFLRYPQKGDEFFLHKDYKTTNHDFNNIIDFIEFKLNQFFIDNWEKSVSDKK